MNNQSVAATEALKCCKTRYKVTVFRSMKTKQVLFLEAGKDFVDTLFSFLVLPVGTIIHILSQGIQQKPFGAISRIFESVDASFLHVDKMELVQPRVASVGCTCGSSAGLQIQRDLEAANLLHLPQKGYSTAYYKCPKCLHFKEYAGTRCETCNTQGVRTCYTYSEGPYSVEKKIPSEEANKSNGFVKGNMTFIVTDALEIIPSTMLSSVSVLKKLNVASLNDLESNNSTVNITEILELLHTALTSNYQCLSSIFGKK